MREHLSTFCAKKRISIWRWRSLIYSEEFSFCVTLISRSNNSRMEHIRLIHRSSAVFCKCIEQKASRQRTSCNCWGPSRTMNRRCRKATTGSVPENAIRANAFHVRKYHIEMIHTRSDGECHFVPLLKDGFRISRYWTVFRWARRAVAGTAVDWRALFGRNWGSSTLDKSNRKHSWLYLKGKCLMAFCLICFLGEKKKRNNLNVIS